MKRLRTMLVTVFLLMALGFGGGYFKATYDEGERQTKKEFMRQKQLVALDQSFLAHIATRPSTLTSGTYVIETHFPGKPPQLQSLDLVFNNGQFAFPKPTNSVLGCMATTLVQKGNVVSWIDEGILYEANAESVGVIDGSLVWGRIYGWNAGDESIGLWRIYPKPTEATTKTLDTGSQSGK